MSVKCRSRRCVNPVSDNCITGTRQSPVLWLLPTSQPVTPSASSLDIQYCRVAECAKCQIWQWPVAAGLDSMTDGFCQLRVIVKQRGLFADCKLSRAISWTAVQRSTRFQLTLSRAVRLQQLSLVCRLVVMRPYFYQFWKLGDDRFSRFCDDFPLKRRNRKTAADHIAHAARKPEG